MSTDPAPSLPSAQEKATPFLCNGLAGALSGTDLERPPLVLLHGLTFNRHLWDPVVAELTTLDPTRRVLALDLPGHGDSDPMAAYDMISVTNRLHDVIEEGDLGTPMVVGHSIAAIVATVYAARFPTHGVINVDQPLLTQPFAEMLHTMADQLRSPAFSSLWSMITRGFHTELLSPSGQELVHTTSNPRHEIVLGYWQEVLEQSVEDLTGYIDATMTTLQERNVPYLVIAGNAPDPHYAAWLRKALPQVRMVVLPDSGHFPHIRHPHRFARILLGQDRGELDNSQER